LIANIIKADREQLAALTPKTKKPPKNSAQP